MWFSFPRKLDSLQTETPNTAGKWLSGMCKKIIYQVAVVTLVWNENLIKKNKNTPPNQQKQ